MNTIEIEKIIELGLLGEFSASIKIDYELKRTEIEYLDILSIKILHKHQLIDITNMIKRVGNKEFNSFKTNVEEYVRENANKWEPF